MLAQKLLALEMDIKCVVVVSFKFILVIIHINIIITYLERVMDVIQDNATGISVQGEMINNLRFADDRSIGGELCCITK